MTDRTKKMLLLGLTVIGTLGAAEVILRVIGYGEVTPRMNFGVNTRSALDQGRFLPDRDLFWKLPSRPDDRRLRAVHPDVPVTAGAGHRLLVMGDSCSRISMRRPPYSVLLEQLLNARAGSGPSAVWNASVPGYTTWQGRVWLDRQLLDLEPEAAVIYYGWNDHWRATGITDRDYAARLQGGGLKLGLLLARAPDPPPLRVPVTEYEENLTAMVERLQEAGSRVILITAPSNLTREAIARLLETRYLVRGDDARALHAEYLAVVRAVARDTGAELLDVAAVFDRVARSRELLMRDGIHLTDAGHGVVAELLAAKISSGTGAPPSLEDLVARARVRLANENDEVETP